MTSVKDTTWLIAETHLFIYLFIFSTVMPLVGHNTKP